MESQPFLPNGLCPFLLNLKPPDVSVYTWQDSLVEKSLKDVYVP